MDYSGIEVQPMRMSGKPAIEVTVTRPSGVSAAKYLTRAEALELAAELIESVEGCDITLATQVRQQAEFVAAR